MTATVLHGDCRTVLASLPANSFDSLVTDPPYGLSKEPDIAEVLRHWLAGDDYTHSGGGFMGKTWDSFVPGPATWREVYRVLKPGAYGLVFAGSRTQDLMSIALRLAGFEIRDSFRYWYEDEEPTTPEEARAAAQTGGGAAWFYSTGFPKSLNLDNLKGLKTCGCMVQSDHEKAEHHLRPVCDSDIPEAVNDEKERREVLQPSVSEQSAPIEGREQLPPTEIRGGQSCMERRCDVQKPEGKLCVGAVCESAAGCFVDGKERRLCDGTPTDYGRMDGADSASVGGGAPHRPQSVEQLAGESGTVAGQPEPQTMGTWSICSRCGLPRLPDGIGTALKPAYEPIILIRKPLIGTVADNILTHGVGGLNIDGCRVPRTDAPPGWPANILHDGCLGGEDFGRYFYCAKASKADRNAGCDDLPTATAGEVTGRVEGSAGASNPRAGMTSKTYKNTHPTVKPTDLMRWCCRLVTPPGGVIIDPFTGSGSTGRGAVLEGFNFLGVELTDEYMPIARARIKEAQS